MKTEYLLLTEHLHATYPSSERAWLLKWSSERHQYDYKFFRPHINSSFISIKGTFSPVESLDKEQFKIKPLTKIDYFLLAL